MASGQINTADTQRGIVNTLDSSSTTDSLSANMGKTLNTKITSAVSDYKSRIAGATKIVGVNAQYTAPANDFVEIPFSFPAQPGYTLIGKAFYTTGDSRCLLVMLGPTSMGVRNILNEAVTATATMANLYYKTTQT